MKSMKSLLDIVHPDLFPLLKLAKFLQNSTYFKSIHDSLKTINP